MVVARYCLVVAPLQKVDVDNSAHDAGLADCGLNQADTAGAKDPVIPLDLRFNNACG